MSDSPNHTALHGTSASLQRTLQFGERLAELLQPGDLVALRGPLGAGKTQLVRGIAAGLGIDPHQVASPTFVLMTEHPGQVPLVHIDAYRIEDLSDLESIGWGEELLAEAVTVVEWADRIEADLPEDLLWIELSHAGEQQREITVEPRGAWAGHAEELREILAGLTSSRPCPTCGKPVEESAERFPFCSQQCKMADLNQWFSGGYRISASLNDAEMPDEEGG